jgi:hypothetical protein
MFSLGGKRESSVPPKPAEKGPGVQAERSARAGAGNGATADLFNSNAGEHPIPTPLRQQMEASFGQSFGDVTIRPEARSADALNAIAFTRGQNIYLSPEAPSLDTAKGARLLSHELAHVVQQRSAGAVLPEVGAPGGALEAEAQQASADVASGKGARVSSGATAPGVQRQAKAEAPVEPDKSSKTSALIVISEYLDREWQAQSKKHRSFKLNDIVRKNLLLIWNKAAFPPQVLSGKTDTAYETPLMLLDQLKDKLPDKIDPLALSVLKRAGGAKKEDKIDAPAPDKDDEAYIAAAKRALQEFLDTKQGQEIAQNAKRFILSADGIPLAFIVIDGVATAVAANDAEIPGLPEIPLPGGIKIKVELKRKDKPEELPKELRPYFVQGDPNAKTPEGYKGVVSVSADIDLENLPAALAKFFVAVGRGIAKGAIKVGTVIKKAVMTIVPELLGLAGGAAIGALIGGLAGGWLGAGIGAAIGAGVGLVASLVRRLFT